MGKVHRLGTLQLCTTEYGRTKMYDLVTDLINKNTHKKDIVNIVSDEFNISSRETHKRIKSMFGKTLDELLTPSKDVVVRCILKSESIDDFKKLIGFNKGLGKLYEKYFNVSTFAAARRVCEQYREITPYNPTLDDNLSIIISQALGDGHLEKRDNGNFRYSLSITHSEQQFDYLVEKVKLLNKAFPNLPPVGTIKRYNHKQGFTYYMYRTNKFDNSVMRKVCHTENHKLVEEMTPLGMFLLYMDDGSFSQSKNAKNLKISNGDIAVLYALQVYLASYNISSSVYEKDMCVVLSNVVSVTKFLNNFVFPFKVYIPECMEYKARLMI